MKSWDGVQREVLLNCKLCNAQNIKGMSSSLEDFSENQDILQGDLFFDIHGRQSARSFQEERIL